MKKIPKRTKPKAMNVYIIFEKEKKRMVQYYSKGFKE